MAEICNVCAGLRTDDDPHSRRSPKEIRWYHLVLTDSANREFVMEKLLICDGCLEEAITKIEEFVENELIQTLGHRVTSEEKT